MSDWSMRKAARALVQGDRFIFAEEFGGENQILTVRSVSCAFGTVTIEVEEHDWSLDFTDKQMVPLAAPAEEVGVEPPTPTLENTPASGTEEIEVFISLRVRKNLAESMKDALVMGLATYAADMRFTLEAGVERNRGASFTDLRFLQNEVQLAADVVKEVDTGEVWGKFTCSEIEAIADVFRAADRHDAAVFIVGEHAEHDEPDDHHYKEDHDDQP